MVYVFLRAGTSADMDSITIFASLDTCKSGSLSLDDLKLALSLGNVEDEVGGAVPRSAYKHLEGLGAGGFRRISLDAIVQELERLFEVLDTDRNGRIDYFEFRRLLDEVDEL